MSSEVCNNLKPRSVAIAFDNAIVEIYKENNRKKDDIWWGLHNLSPVNNHGIYTIAIREVLTTENTGIKYKAGSQYPIMFSGMLDGIVKHTGAYWKSEEIKSIVINSAKTLMEIDKTTSERTTAEMKEHPGLLSSDVCWGVLGERARGRF